MELIIKPFAQLSLEELYDILRVRAEVFVVEQECPYLDPDGTDLFSMHFILKQGQTTAAYLRLFEKEPGVMQIGRVLTTIRGAGYGAMILHAAVEAVKNMKNVHTVMLEAQTYAVGFYEREGFAVCSDEFDEDGIPHVCMQLRMAQ